VGKDRPGRSAEESHLTPRRHGTHGRRLGRPLRRGRREALTEWLPKLRVELPYFGLLDPHDLFSGSIQRIWLEIGAGNGDHAVWQAEANPDTGVIAVEPFVNGVANLAAQVRAKGLSNVRIVDGDVRPLIDCLPPASLDRVFILFPDPWPKRRHWRRRIVNRAVLDEIARRMRVGAELRIATDHQDYLVWMLQHLRQHPALRWSPKSADDWRRRPDDWPETRFEAKGAEAGRRSTYLTLTRVGYGDGY